MSDISEDILGCQEGKYKTLSVQSSHPITAKGYYMCPFESLALGVCGHTIKRDYEGHMGQTEFIYECSIKGSED